MVAMMRSVISSMVAACVCTAMMCPLESLTAMRVFLSAPSSSGAPSVSALGLKTTTIYPVDTMSAPCSRMAAARAPTGALVSAWCFTKMWCTSPPMLARQPLAPSV